MGTSDLISTWGSTKNSIEAMASFLNSFPMFKDDTRNTHPKFVANATYNSLVVKVNQEVISI